MICFTEVSFVDSVYSIKKLPEQRYPEIAFAGRSNVGKSSLMNSLVQRKNLVKTSSKPGKTQSLNFFLLKGGMYLVDLPGYGFAKVGAATRSAWDQLIGSYLLQRQNLACVVVVLDLRHELKSLDRNMINWLHVQGKPSLPVYTKADKLSANAQAKQAALLDAALNISAGDRLIFSAKTGQGCEELRQRLVAYGAALDLEHLSTPEP